MISQHNKIVIIPEMQRWFNICKSIDVINYINVLKTKNHMTVSIDTEMDLKKNQHASIIKFLENSGLEETYHNLIKGIFA